MIMPEEMPSEGALSVEHEAQRRLESASLRPITNRVVVLAVIMESGQAISARKVLEEVAQRRRMNRVTVYRILDLLFENGVINRIPSGEQGHLYCVGRDHSHFHCTSCGVVQCVDNVTLHFNQDAVVNAVPMSVQRVDLHLEGMCSQCAAHKH